MSLMLLGNVVACVYALVTLIRARGDWRLFWLGAQAQSKRA